MGFIWLCHEWLIFKRESVVLTMIIFQELQVQMANAEECSDELMRIRKEIVDFHGEMVLLENYSALNYTGILFFIYLLSPNKFSWHIFLYMVKQCCRSNILSFMYVHTLLSWGWISTDEPLFWSIHCGSSMFHSWIKYIWLSGNASMSVMLEQTKLQFHSLFENLLVHGLQSLFNDSYIWCNHY